MLPKFSPEPKFEPELQRTGPKFSPRFRYIAEPNARFDSAFKQTVVPLNAFELGSNRTSAPYFVHRTVPVELKKKEKKNCAARKMDTLTVVPNRIIIPLYLT